MNAAGNLFRALSDFFPAILINWKAFEEKFGQRLVWSVLELFRVLEIGRIYYFVKITNNTGCSIKSTSETVYYFLGVKKWGHYDERGAVWFWGIGIISRKKAPSDTEMINRMRHWKLGKARDSRSRKVKKIAWNRTICRYLFVNQHQHKLSLRITVVASHPKLFFSSHELFK